MKMEAEDSSKALVTISETTWCHKQYYSKKVTVEHNFEIVIISVQQKYSVKYALRLHRSKRDQEMNMNGKWIQISKMFMAHLKSLSYNLLGETKKKY
jgi:hypothetical protein